MRLQDTYKLDPETLSRGNLPGKCIKVLHEKEGNGDIVKLSKSLFSIAMSDIGAESPSS